MNVAALEETLSKQVMGYAGLETSPVDPMADDLEFILRYGLTIDGQHFDFGDKYKHLIDVYRDDWPFQVLMAGAQTGKSARLMARMLRTAILRWGSMIGYYFPDFFLPRAFSTQRFRPFVASSDELREWLGSNATKGKGTDAVLTRSFGPSVFYFLSVAGRTSTEGLPLQAVFFDEVRRMSSGDIMRAQERYSAQADPIDMKVSTACYPEADIHAHFLEGDQRFFHTDCSCSEGVVLSQRYPDCIAEIEDGTEFKRKVQHAFSHAGRPYLGSTEKQIAQFGEACYICPDCGDILTDPREGWWEPHNPEAYVHSYQMPQLLSWTYPAARILRAGENPLDLQEFHNSKLGLPFLDPEAQPVQLSDLQASVNMDTDCRWAMRMTRDWRRKNLKNCALGLDAMGGYNCIVVKMLAPNGKYRTIHLEIIHGDDPWRESAKLMVELNVRAAVIDQNPHYNEALRFAKAFPGKVFLANYDEHAGTKGKGPMVKWHDRARDPKDQKGRQIKDKYRVSINRTKGLQWSLKRWKHGANETPHPDELIQELPKQKGKVILTPGLKVGKMAPTPICREVYWLHLRRIVFRKLFASEDAERRGEFKVVAEHVGLDPHFGHSDLYANVALARIGSPAGPRSLHE